MHTHPPRPTVDHPLTGSVRFGMLLIVLVWALVNAALTVRPLAAQPGGSLAYNTITPGQLVGTGLVSYTFAGTAGDLVTLRVTGSGGLNPALVVIAPDNQPLVSADDHNWADRREDAFVSHFLPQTGTYTVLVSGNGSAGSFTLLLGGRPPVIAEPLPYDAPVRAEIPVSPPPQYWTFTAENCPTTLTITNETGGDPFTFPYTAIVRDELGTRIGELRGGRALQNRLTVPANSGTYEVELASADALTAGTLLLTVTCAERQPDCTVSVPALIVPPTPTPTATAPAGQFLLIQSGGSLVYPQQDIIAPLTTAAPLLAHPFTGTAGDWIAIEVTGLTPGLDPYVRLISPSAAALSLDDAAFPLSVGAVYLSAFLTETGTYTLLVGAETAATGEYLLRFTGRTPVTSTPLTVGVPQTVTIPPPSALTPPPNDPQYFTFAAQDCPTTLTITDRSGFPFAAIVRDERGVVVARLRGEPLTEARVTVAPRSGAYEVEVLSMADDRGGTLELLVTCAGDAPLCGTFGGLPVSTPRPGWTPVRPVATPTPGPSPTPSATPTLPPCPPGVVIVPQPFIDSYARLAPDTVRQVPTASVGTGVPELEIAPVRPSPTPGGPTRTPPRIEIEPIGTLPTEDPAALATRFAEELTRNPAVGTRVIVELTRGNPLAQTLAPFLTPPGSVPSGTVTPPAPTITATATPCATITPTRPPATRVPNTPVPTLTPFIPTEQPTVPPPPPTDPPTVPPPFCGDGVCNGGEAGDCQCQDCFADPAWIALCLPPTVPPPTVPPPPFCGDGICQPTEYGGSTVCDANNQCTFVCNCVDCSLQFQCFGP